MINALSPHLRTDRALIHRENEVIAYCLYRWRRRGRCLEGENPLVALSDAPGARDFDFLHGAWRIVNERLVSRLTNSDEWERFEAEGICRPILGGIGNIDSFSPREGKWQGFEGASLRIFNPQTGLWSIYWADNVICGLTPPVVGRFTDNVGEFYGDDTHEGTTVRARFIWSGITPTSAHWEQAFSADGGLSWEKNWTMAFTRDDAR
jgi:hypothetical protein